MPIRYSSASIESLVSELSRLPGIGRRTAQRLAMTIVKYSKADIARFVNALNDVSEHVHLCSSCANLTEDEVCDICRNPGRDSSTICVVEGTPDVLAIEKTGAYKGHYHVLHGVLSPLDGVGPEDLKIKEFVARLVDGITEVILATNPSVEGEATATFLCRLIKPMDIKTTRIAQGLPMGSAIELADQSTLARALSSRSVI